MCILIFNGQKLSAAVGKFGLKMQAITLFKEKMELSVVFKIEVYVVTNWSTRLEKH